VRIFRKLYEPEFFQGSLRRRHSYFEGWYFKVVTPSGAFATIPGVSLAPDDPHAFIQIIDGTSGTASYTRFPIEAFTATDDEFSVSIGESSFSFTSVVCRVEDREIQYEILTPSLWRGTLLQPGTMGWYSFVPLMECRHGILVMDAEVRFPASGERGRLYVEKDYGRSFPNAWIWLQTNTFPEQGVSVTCSIANVPFIGGAFTGFLAGILVDGRLWKFTTYTGARLRAIGYSETAVEIDIADRSGHELMIRASREEGAALVAPRQGVMDGRVVETLDSRVYVQLRDSGVTVYEGTGEHAGLEVVEPERLIPTRRR
jgi:hypothetical protein